MSRYQRCFNRVALLLAVACVTACSSQTAIGDINRDPGRFTGKEVTIQGRTSNSVGFLSTGVYQVEDGTGSILVFSQDFGLPAKGAKVVVTGQVQQGFSFGGQNYGLIFRQTKARE